MPAVVFYNGAMISGVLQGTPFQGTVTKVRSNKDNENEEAITVLFQPPIQVNGEILDIETLYMNIDTGAVSLPVNSSIDYAVEWEPPYSRGQHVCGTVRANDGEMVNWTGVVGAVENHFSRRMHGVEVRLDKAVPIGILAQRAVLHIIVYPGGTSKYPDKVTIEHQVEA